MQPPQQPTRRITTSTPTRDHERPTQPQPSAPHPAAGASDGSRPDRDVPQKPSQLGALSPAGLVVGGAAAATASVIGGQLGTAGTVIGAFITSVVSATALALYSDSIAHSRRAMRKLQRMSERRGRRGLSRTSGPAGAPAEQDAAHDGTGSHEAGSGRATPGDIAAVQATRPRWVRILVSAIAIALLAALAIFGIQQFTGAELSPGTGTIQRTVTGSTRVSPADEKPLETPPGGDRTDAPTPTEQDQPGTAPSAPTDAPTEAPGGTDPNPSPSVPDQQNGNGGSSGGGSTQQPGSGTDPGNGQDSQQDSGTTQGSGSKQGSGTVQGSGAPQGAGAQPGSATSIGAGTLSER